MPRNSLPGPQDLPLSYCTVYVATLDGGDASPVTEVAALKVEDGHAGATFHSLVRSDDGARADLPDTAGVAAAGPQDAPSLEHVVSELIGFVGDMPLVGADRAALARPCIERCAKEACGTVMGNDWYDALDLAADLGLAPLGSLADLCARFDVKADGQSRAQAGATAIWRCWELMRDEAAGRADRSAQPVDEPRELAPETGAIAPKRAAHKHRIWVVVTAVFAIVDVSYIIQGVSGGADAETIVTGTTLFTALAAYSLSRCAKYAAPKARKAGDGED